MLFRLNARQHDDLIFTISQAVLDERYQPPKRRRSAWHEGFDEDLEQARRVAAAIVGALRRGGFQISRNPPAPRQHAAAAPTSVRTSCLTCSRISAAMALRVAASGKLGS